MHKIFKTQVLYSNINYVYVYDTQKLEYILKSCSKAGFTRARKLRNIIERSFKVIC